DTRFNQLHATLDQFKASGSSSSSNVSTTQPESHKEKCPETFSLNPNVTPQTLASHNVPNYTYNNSSPP
ncbi:37108_t:CDS:2, partial [Gigaspora margarita]